MALKASSYAVFTFNFDGRNLIINGSSINELLVSPVLFTFKSDRPSSKVSMFVNCSFTGRLSRGACWSLTNVIETPSSTFTITVTFTVSIRILTSENLMFRSQTLIDFSFVTFWFWGHILSVHSSSIAATQSLFTTPVIHNLSISFSIVIHLFSTLADTIIQAPDTIDGFTLTSHLTSKHAALNSPIFSGVVLRWSDGEHFTFILEATFKLPQWFFFGHITHWCNWTVKLGWSGAIGHKTSVTSIQSESGISEDSATGCAFLSTFSLFSDGSFHIFTAHLTAIVDINHSTA
jgi:uncharacterized membrane protein